MRYQLRLLIACLCILLPGRGGAQLLSGRAVEEGTLAPVRNVEIAVLDSDSTAVLRLVTDSAGSFSGVLPRSGAYQLSVEHISFLAYRSPAFEVARGESVQLEVRLGRSVVPLDPLIVTGRATTIGRLAGFRERQRTRPFGTIITREQIERRPGAAVTDLLRVAPGVSIVSVPRGANPNAMAQMIAMRGTRTGEVEGFGDANWCLPGIFVDGVRIQQTAEVPVDDFFRADHLEGVEVYSSAARIPIEYQQGSTVACGAVLFWTRQGEPGGGRSGWWRWALGLGAFGGILLLMR